MRLMALTWLEKQYNKTVVDIQHALDKPCTMEEHDNLQHKACMLLWMINALKEDAHEGNVVH